jgi:hypothetical protein
MYFASSGELVEYILILSSPDYSYKLIIGVSLWNITTLIE